MSPCPYCSNAQSHTHTVRLDNGRTFVDGSPYIQPPVETGSAATVCARTGCDNEAAKGSPSCRFHTDNPPTTDPRTATVCVWCLGGGILLIDGEPAGPCRDCNGTGTSPASSREG
jgi:hypothetical protein